jgi:adenylosuccinate synthase
MGSLNYSYLNGCSTVGILCEQWGDSGKGKEVHRHARWANIVVRSFGGANAGHTVVDGDQRWVQRLLPCGIAYDGDGIINVIGSGVAFDPAVAAAEVLQMRPRGIACANLQISHRAKLVLPQHVLLDRLRESTAGDGRIGTTGSGMGPVHGDFRDWRNGLFVNDLLNPDVFVRKLRANLAQKIRLLRTFDPETVRTIMHKPALGSGVYYDHEQIVDVDAVVEQYMRHAQVFGPMVVDTDAFLQASHGKKRILLEGAQGYLLGVEDGTYPYVTPSDCTANGLARGAGLNERDIDLVIGTTKGFYMTRVGMGPFPTEFGGQASAEWCNDPDVTETTELERYPDASVNSKHEFERGVALRRRAREYGAVTGRPRRTGRVDVPLLRRALRHVGRTELALMRLDIMDECEAIEICTGHRYVGPAYSLANVQLRHGAMFGEADLDCEVLSNVEPIYETVPGWCTPTSGARTVADLPAKLLSAAARIEQLVGCKVRILSVGPDRRETVIVE